MFFMPIGVDLNQCAKPMGLDFYCFVFVKEKLIKIIIKKDNTFPSKCS